MCPLRSECSRLFIAGEDLPAGGDVPSFKGQSIRRFHMTALLKVSGFHLSGPRSAALNHTGDVEVLRRGGDGSAVNRSFKTYGAICGDGDSPVFGTDSAGLCGADIPSRNGDRSIGFDPAFNRYGVRCRERGCPFGFGVSDQLQIPG